jgi:opacity protein-like surface antigen
MRSRFVLTLLVASLVVSLMPPGVSAQQWNLNLYGGWSYSNLTGGSAKMLGGDYKSGFGGGVAGELKLNEDWGWEFGLWYVQKGAKGAFSTNNEGEGFLPRPDDNFDGSFSLDYVEMPILVNMYFPVGEKANIRGFLGPAFAFLTKAKAEGTLNGESTSLDMGDRIDDADITFIVGAGGQFELDRINLMLDFRWDIGATNISQVEGATIRNNTVLITVAVGIPLSSFDE